MYTVELHFECYQNTTISRVDQAISAYLDALRYNGQVLGREFPTTMGDGVFITRVVCPETDSVSPTYHSRLVHKLREQLHQAGLG